MAVKSKVVIFGAGGHGKVVLDILLEAGHCVLGFIDDDKSKKGQEVRGYEVLGDWSYLKKASGVKIALGIGNNKIRGDIFYKAKDAGADLITAIHPKAVVSKDSATGKGVVIMPGAVVNSGAALEDGVVINTGATVDHDCRLGRFCQLWPGAHLAGTVSIGEFSYVGTGAAIVQNITIGKNTMIGAGAVIISDQPDNVTVVGNPGKVIKKNG